jgi:predicted transcriptional regulator
MTAAYDVLKELKCATVREVAARLGVAYNTARKYLKRLVNKGLVEMRRVGRYVMYCVVEREELVPRGVHKLHIETRRRMHKVVELLQRDGCVSVSALMRIMRINHTKAYHLMRVSLLTGRGVKVRVGNTAVLCRDRETADEVISRIRETVHRLAVENGMRYATPTKILQAALRDRDAYELLSVFIPLRRNMDKFPPAVLKFVDDILRSLYGEPVRYRRKTVYVVTQPRDYTVSLVTDSAETRPVQVKLPDDLAVALQGANVNEVVLQALEQLLQRYRP